MAFIPHFYSIMPSIPSRTPLLAFARAPRPVVRVGFVGLGQRGQRTLERYALMDGVEITALSDLNPRHLFRAQQILQQAGRDRAKEYEGEEGWQTLAQREEVDLVYICTPWAAHAPMAVYAMRKGKDVAVEVPAAVTGEECALLVRTAEETRCHCFMTENCCYDRFSLATLEMAREGRFGEIIHCEGAYLHDLYSALQESHGDARTSLAWMNERSLHHEGNPYPTHGIGPIGWLLSLHRGDRMRHLVSMSSDVRKDGALIGRINNTLIQTALGKSILLQFDITTPRPYSRIQTLCGTRGYAQKYPVPTLQFQGAPTLSGPEVEEELKRYETSPASRYWQEGQAKGVANEMNYAMDARLIHCLREGLPLDIDVYDAAEWSCLAQLSQLSALRGGQPMEIPDFTNGHWQELEGQHFY